MSLSSPESRALNARHVASIAGSSDLQAVEALFDRYGSQRATILADPASEAILDPDIADFQQLYERLRPAAGQPPPWSAFDIREMRRLVGSLHVLERQADDGAMRYLVYGTDVAARYGRDQTGRTVADHEASLAVVFHGLFLASAATGRCYYSTHHPPEDSPVRDCQRLIAPFHGEDGNFHRLVVAQRPMRTSRAQVGGTL